MPLPTSTFFFPEWKHGGFEWTDFKISWWEAKIRFLHCLSYFKNRFHFLDTSNKSDTWNNIFQYLWCHYYLALGFSPSHPKVKLEERGFIYHILSVRLLCSEASCLKARPQYLPSCVSFLVLPQLMTRNWVPSKNRNISLSLAVLEVGSLKSRCRQGKFLVETQRQCSVPLSHSRGWRQTLAILGLQLHLSSLCFFCHVAFTLCFLMFKFLFLEGQQWLD